MKRNILSLMLALALLLTLFPVSVGATVAAPTLDEHTAWIKSLAEEQFDAFFAGIDGGSASDAAWELVRHSVRNGGDLNMTVANTKFSRALMNTEMLRAAISHAAAAVHLSSQTPKEDSIYMHGSIHWYENVHAYSSTAVVDDKDEGDEGYAFLVPMIRGRANPYTGPMNDYDEAMYLVVGGCDVRYTFRTVSVTADTVTYRVNFTIKDEFEFEGSYEGDDRQLETLLNYVGRMLSLGLLHTFHWSVSGEYELTLPNLCTHESAANRWEFNGDQDLFPVEGNGFQRNPLHKERGTTRNGVFDDTVYIAATAMRMAHDLPWTLEFQCAGNGSFSISESQSGSSGGVYLRKTDDALLFGEAYLVNETDENKTYFFYGIYFTRNQTVSGTEPHVYRLENRIAEDGSNMVYLYVDDVEIGPMNEYVRSGKWGQSDWISGKDFTLSYIGSFARPLQDVTMDYIAFWENGKGNDDVSFLTSHTVSPTCTSGGYTEHFCTLCGAVFRGDETPAAGHSWDSGTVTREPTEQAEGECRYTCTICGTDRTESIEKLPHFHRYGSWVTVSEPTGKADGEERRSCECGAYESCAIPKLTNPFTDVEESDYYYEPVLWAVYKNITAGTSSDTFSPKESCTRAQVVTFLWRTAGCPEPADTENPFTDVDADDYYNKAVLWAVEQGVTLGTSETTFSPNETCTRAQIVTFLWRAMGEPEPQSPENPFSDVAETDYFHKAVLWAVENSITAGTGHGKFSPAEDCSRDQVITFLWRTRT